MTTPDTITITALAQLEVAILAAANMVHVIRMDSVRGDITTEHASEAINETLLKLIVELES